MSFKALFLAHAPDADSEIHRAKIETPEMYKLFVVLVKNQKEAVDVARRLVKEENIHSILLCPGFTHKDVAEIQENVGDNVSVAVARSDGKGNRVVTEILRKEGWLK